MVPTSKFFFFVKIFTYNVLIWTLQYSNESSTLGKSCSNSESQNSSLGIRSSRLLKGETVLDLGTRSNNNQRRNGLNTLISFDKNFESSTDSIFPDENIRNKHKKKSQNGNFESSTDSIFPDKNIRNKHKKLNQNRNFESSTDSIFPDENIRNKHKKKSQNGNFASSTDSIFPDENIINKHKKLNQNRNFESSMDSIFPDENIRNKHKKLNQNRNFESSTDSIFTDENIRNKRKKQNQNSKFERNFDVSMYGHNKRDSSGSVAYIDDSNSSYSSLYNKKDYYKEKLHNKNGIKVNRKKAKEDISELEKRKGNQEKCLVTYVMNFISKSDALYETELLKYMTMYNKHGRDGKLSAKKRFFNFFTVSSIVLVNFIFLLVSLISKSTGGIVTFTIFLALSLIYVFYKSLKCRKMCKQLH
ncbi:hypothetical protein MKS88_003950 [Plasmodium brasilianum]|uniref:Uncharacterized protein n=1 Tax=Plasmodium brasilianum TaxID=5824 RepID=A0ACB9Y8E5_PLABR|nr:hypothetical protein MKS88_003950 [Plasmodium brasilianum]